MKNPYDYDVIVCGASILGSVASVVLKRKKYNVLLCNSFGFPGGSITESLNCLQSVAPRDSRSLTTRVLTGLGKEKHGFLYSEGDEAVLNPESLKFVLQKLLIEFNVNMLFHVRPKRIELGDPGAKLFFTAKEGEIHFSTRKIIDATDDNTLAELAGGDRASDREWFYNFISTPGMESEIVELFEPFLYRRLSDGRFWISRRLDIEDELLAEYEAQREMSLISSSIKDKGIRIQLLPAMSFTRRKIKRPQTGSRIIDFPDSVLKRDFRSGESIIKSEYFENFIGENY